MRGALKLLLVPFMALSLTACDEVEYGGALNVYEPLSFAHEDGTVEIPTGSYSAELEINDVITFRLSQGNVAWEEFKVKVPKSFKLPTNGNFELLPSETGLTYNIIGTVDTMVTKGEEISEMEFCNGNYGGTGRRIVRYYVETTLSDLYFMFMNGAVHTADFSGVSEKTERVYTYYGNCMGGNNPPNPIPPNYP